MAIRQFLNSQEKKIGNDLEIIIDKIVKVYSIDDKTYKTNKENIIISKSGYFEIM